MVEVHGYAKQGAGYGYTRQLGYHPLLATGWTPARSCTPRMRKASANTARGAQRFVRETIGRARRAGAAGPVLLRADSGSWSHKTSAPAPTTTPASPSPCARPQVRDTIDAIPEQAWVDIDYTDSGVAQVAETRLGDHRLIVRRTRLAGAQEALFPDWRHHAFVTDRTGSPVDLDADHRPPSSSSPSATSNKGRSYGCHP